MSTHIEVMDYLPDGFREAEEAFRLGARRPSRGRLTLRELCERSAFVGGDTFCRDARDWPDLPRRYPGFRISDEAPLRIGEGFDVAHVAAGEVLVELRHTLPFTLLRGPEGTHGSIEVALVIDGEPVVSRTVTGEDEPFPPGPEAALVVTLPLRGVDVSPGAMVRLAVESTGSDEAYPADLEQSLHYTVSTRDFEIPWIRITRSSVTVLPRIVAIDIGEEVRAELKDPLLGARLGYRVEKPNGWPDSDLALALFPTRGAAEAEADTIASETFRLRGQSTSSTLALSGDQVRRMLDGKGGFLRLGGELMGGTFVVEPWGRLGLEARVDFDLVVNRP